MDKKEIERLLYYNSESGLFQWKITIPNKFGHTAGTTVNSGYRVIRIRDKSYLAHRLAWFLIYNEWPKGEIDHINGDRLDNRIENLRDTTRQENAYNRGAGKNNKLGVKGIRQRGNSFAVRIRNKNGEILNIGSFKTLDEAKEAYLKLAIEIHGEFIHSSLLKK